MQIPYLPVDPQDINMTYEAVIRVNSQSGKGGVAYLVQRALGLDLPRRMQVAFYQVVQAISDRTSKEITAEDIEKAFRASYFLGDAYRGRFDLVQYSIEGDSGKRAIKGTITDAGKEYAIEGVGNGPVSALLDALRKVGCNLQVKEYSEHSIGAGSEVKAASYVELVNRKGESFWGVGIDEDVTAASLRAVLSASSNAVAGSEQRSKEVEDIVVGPRP